MGENFSEHIGGKLRVLVAASGLSQTDFARQYNINKGRLNRLIKGTEKQAGVEFAIRLAAKMGLPPDYFFPPEEARYYFHVPPRPAEQAGQLEIKGEIDIDMKVHPLKNKQFFYGLWGDMPSGAFGLRALTSIYLGGLYTFGGGDVLAFVPAAKAEHGQAVLMRKNNKQKTKYLRRYWVSDNGRPYLTKGIQGEIEEIPNRSDAELYAVMVAFTGKR